jgi:hypothetical protein
VRTASLKGEQEEAFCVGKPQACVSAVRGILTSICCRLRRR